MKVLSDLPSGTPVSLIAEFTALPGREEAVAALLAGLASKVRNEDGNVAFDCYRRLETLQSSLFTKSTGIRRRSKFT